MHSIFKWQKINFQTSQFNHFAFCCKSMTYGGHNVAKVFFFTCPTNPIWVWVQRIPSFFLYYCKQKYGHHLCEAWGFMLQNQGNMPWWHWQNVSPPVADGPVHGHICIWNLNTKAITHETWHTTPGDWRQRHGAIDTIIDPLPETIPSYAWPRDTWHLV